MNDRQYTSPPASRKAGELISAEERAVAASWAGLQQAIDETDWGAVELPPLSDVVAENERHVHLRDLVDAVSWPLPSMTRNTT